VTRNVRLADRLELRWSRSLDDYVTTMTVSPDGSMVLVGALSGRGEVLDLVDGRAVRSLEPHPMGVLAAGWAHDGCRFATAGQDARVRIFRPDRSDRTVTVDLAGWGAALAWSPVDRLVAVGAGRTVVVIDGDGEEVASWGELPSTVTALAWSPDGVSLGAACYGGVQWFRPAEPGRPVKAMPWKGSLLTLAVAPNGRWVAAGCQDESVHIWRLWTGDDLQMAGYATKVEHIAWDPSSRYLAVGGVDDVTVWDFAGRGPQGSSPLFLDGHGGGVTALAYRPDGSRLASGDAGGLLSLWGPPSSSPTGSVEMGEPLSGVGWSPDGATLVVGSAHGTVTAVSVDGPER